MSQLHAPATLPPEREANGSQSWSEEEEKSLMPLPEIKPRFLDRPARNLFATLTELSGFIQFCTLSQILLDFDIGDVVE
jgi:hypothetical protein